MVPPTRRSLLSGAAGLAAGLAGCSGPIDGSADPTSTATRTEEPVADGPPSGSVADPETLRIRVDSDRPPVWLADPDDTDGGRPTAREDDRYIESTLVDSSSRADRLAVAALADSDRVDSFLAATDFDRETVSIQTLRVEECFRLDLCRVSWHSTEISTDYARSTRPYNEHCVADERVFVAWFVRIPDALDSDRVNTYSSSVGTGVCEENRRAGGDAEGVAGPVTTADTGSRTAAGTDAVEREGEQ